MGQDDDEAVVFGHDGASNLEEFNRPARFADGLHKGVEARILGIKGDAVIRTVVRSALLRCTPAGITALRLPISLASWSWTATTRVTAFAARSATKITATAWATWARPTLELAALSAWTGSTGGSGTTCGSGWSALTGNGRTPKRTSVTPVRRTTSAFTPGPIASFVIPTVARGRLFLCPLSAETEALQLAQIEFVEIRGRILLGSIVVHVVWKRVQRPA